MPRPRREVLERVGHGDGHPPHLVPHAIGQRRHTVLVDEPEDGVVDPVVVHHEGPLPGLLVEVTERSGHGQLAGAGKPRDDVEA